jgi:hypothetical protein
MSYFFNVFETDSGMEVQKPPPSSVPPYFPGGMVAQAYRMSAASAAKDKAKGGAAPKPPNAADWSVFFRGVKGRSKKKFKSLYLNFHSLNPAEAQALADHLVLAASSLIVQARAPGNNIKVEIDISSVLSSRPGR